MRLPGFFAAGVWGTWTGKTRQAVDLYVPRRIAWSFSAVATGGLAGSALDRFASPELGLGLHHGLPRGLPAFQLDYVVTRVG